VLNQRGVLDKFIGDAVMALYGPFLDGDVNVSARATASALEMLDRLERLNRRWEEEGLPQFRIGIGIHVGEAIVGNIGTVKRMQFTALGDAVNLASRLQSATKDLKTELVVSRPVREEAGPLLEGLAGFTDRGTISVKGREQPVEVYEARRSRGDREETGHGTSAEEVGTA
jgi:adenylate cyclase